ncbi:hypothetical protein KNU62_gp58 [Gordonia phage Bakery]|uniref:Uncharacterized protein n=1 Tax=Gordonia phage Bakery TaxID=2591205 RepID=A0A514DGV7_9CAUD|nr:hypothetical protein KNU62_gp58 [Gordonia phage Bakery]QDH92843.1 hypothetical protein SEA_BAKERY_58 [Gordonia phage Bakery]
MNGPQHYQAAERLIEEGRETVAKIAAVHEDPMTMDEVRARRDDLGKRAMGIWAQAQAHATLALAAATALSGVIGHNLAPSHPANQLAHDAETIHAVNAWHEAAAR